MMEAKRIFQNMWAKELIGLLTVLIATAGSSAAWAASGVLEISQACAVTTGCFEGDTPGFPVTIPAEAAGGSFVLTSNLVVPRAALGGISIARDAADVMLDLNGFEVRSPWCVGPPTTPCVPPDYEEGKDGISQASSPAGRGKGLTVKNGTVRGFSGAGVRTGEDGFVDNVTASSNGGQGIYVYDGSIVVATGTYGNRGSGVFVCCQVAGGSGSLVIGSQSNSNIEAGFKAGSSVLIRASSAIYNQTLGFRTVLSSLLVENAATGNQVDGFDGAGVSLYLRNRAYANEGVGFRAAPNGAANLVANTSVENLGGQIDIASETSGYRKNAVDGLGGSIWGGTSTGNNFCTGVPTYVCP